MSKLPIPALVSEVPIKPSLGEGPPSTVMKPTGSFPRTATATRSRSDSADFSSHALYMRLAASIPKRGSIANLLHGATASTNGLSADSSVVRTGLTRSSEGSVGDAAGRRLSRSSCTSTRWKPKRSWIGPASTEGAKERYTQSRSASRPAATASTKARSVRSTTLTRPIRLPKNWESQGRTSTQAVDEADFWGIVCLSQ